MFANTEPLISVLMPAYNHERYVEAAVRSVLEQDWPRVELLVLDDGSRDGTWRVLQELRAKCEKRLERVVINRQENAGIRATLSRLWSASRGEFVILLASDDVCSEGAFRSLARALQKDRSAGLAVGRCALMDGEGRPCYWGNDGQVVYDRLEDVYETVNEYLRWKTGIGSESKAFGTYEAFLHGNHIANGYLIRRSCFMRILPYPQESVLEDYWMHLQLSKVAKYVAIPELTFRYRWHATNTMRDTERITAMLRETMRWEERWLWNHHDRRRLFQFLGVRAERLPDRGIRGVFCVEWFATADYVYGITRVFGLRFRIRRIAKNG